MHLPLCDFQAIVDRLPPFHTVILQGVGEPLLAPDLLEMVRIAAKKGARVSIVTNGQLLAPKVMAAIEQAGCSDLVVSVDSVCETLPSPIHAVEHAVGALSRATAVLQSGVLRGSLSVIASLSLHPSSIQSIVPTLEAVSAAGIGLVRLDYVNEIARNPQGPGWYYGRPSLRSGQAADILEVAAPALERLGLTALLGWRLRADLTRGDWSPSSTALRRAVGSRRIGQCRQPWTGVYVTVQGELTPCCHVPDPAVLSFGNILEQPFDRIMQSPVAVDFRRSLRDCTPTAFCSSCPCFVS